MLASSTGLSIGWQHFYGWLNPFTTFLAALAAGWFGYLQYKINNRLKELQDYVGISIIPLKDLKLQITNVGRTNLYLHRWEVGENSDTFDKPILISAEGRTNLIITLHPYIINRKMAKFYLTDESNRKFLSEGAVILEPLQSTPILSEIRLPSQQENTAVTATPIVAGVSIQVNMVAFSYRTRPFQWNI